MRLSSIKSKTYVKNQMKNSQKYFMPFWVNRKDLEIESDVANWAQIFDKCDSDKLKYRQEYRISTM